MNEELRLARGILSNGITELGTPHCCKVCGKDLGWERSSCACSVDCLRAGQGFVTTDCSMCQRYGLLYVLADGKRRWATCPHGQGGGYCNCAECLTYKQEKPHAPNP
jgi:hypothetical protein